MVNSKFVLFLAFFAACKAWDLSHIGIKDFSLLHVSVFRNHAYLSIRVSNQCKNNSAYSLVETTWPDGEIYAKGRPYPSREWHRPGDCETLQNVIYTDVDLLGRIWILDNGNKDFDCPAKLIVFNIFSNQIIHTFKLYNNSINVASVKIDPTTLHWGQKAYVGVSNGNIMYICSTRNDHCTHVILSEEKQKNVIKNSLTSTENIAVSKFDNNIFITSPNSLSMFAVTLDTIRKYEHKQSKQNGHIEMTAKFLGEKLGPSHGLLVDSARGLFYYLTRDFAIVRWDTRKPLKAESHDVLAQSYQLLPNVTDLLCDSHRSVWAVTNPTYTSQRRPYLKTNKKKNKSNSIMKEQNSTPSCLKIVDHAYLLV